MSRINITITKTLISFIFLAINACGPSRNITYFSNLKATGNTTEEIKNRTDPKIQSDDLLSITVSSLNPEANLLFNSGILQSASSTAGAAPTASKLNEGYLVDKNGAINFPVLGAIKLAGLTKEQATDKMTVEIKHHIKDPIVNIRFLNFRITVIGEVNRPSTFTIPTERVNLVEALALAGDMTAYGKRENVLIIRESDGVRTTTRVDLNDKEALNSPYYYLQQNDILYVEPAKIKQLQGGSGSFYLGIASASISILSLFIIFFR
ncbi:MAG: sugar transporter [Hymenobacter sp.]|nr:MAG: sugar transporter [Hymenobacter sp.]